MRKRADRFDNKVGIFDDALVRAAESHAARIRRAASGERGQTVDALAKAEERAARSNRRAALSRRKVGAFDDALVAAAERHAAEIESGRRPRF